MVNRYSLGDANKKVSELNNGIARESIVDASINFETEFTTREETNQQDFRRDSDGSKKCTDVNRDMAVARDDVTKIETNPSSISGTQTRRRWVVLGACIMNFSIILGAVRGSSVLYLDIIDVLGASRAEAASVNALLYGFTSSIGIVSGIVIQHLGIRKASLLGALLSVLGWVLAGLFTSHYTHLIIYIDIIGGLGFSIGYTSSLVAARTYFDGKWMSMALSLVQFGGACGNACVTYFLSFLNETYGLKGCYLAYAGMLAQTVWGAALMKPKQQSVNNRVGDQLHEPSTLTTKLKLILKQMARLCTNKAFICNSLGMSIQMGASAIPSMLVVDYYVSVGYDRDVGVFLAVLMNTAGLLSRLLPGLLKFIPRLSSFTIAAISSLSGGIPTLIMPWMLNYSANVVFVFMIGWSYSLGSSLFPITTSKLVDISDYPTALGMVGTICGLSMSVAAPIGGFIKDVTGSYAIVFKIAGAAYMSSSVLFIAALYFRRRNLKLDERDT